MKLIRTKKLLQTTAILLTACGLSACATLFGDSNDQVMIHSNQPSAKILVNGNQVGTGSAMYSLPRGKTATLTASKKGCMDTTIATGETVVPATFFNVFFWPGFIVDALTGKISKADPTDYTITPNCGG